MITHLELMEQASATPRLHDFAEAGGFRTGLRFLLAEWHRRLESKLKLVALSTQQQRKRLPLEINDINPAFRTETWT